MPSADPLREIVLVRHAETEWSRLGRHTGRTDVPLTERGRAAARALAARLSSYEFTLVLRSPARRVLETCELCGLAGVAQARDDLWEWDYGEYEGLTTAKIRAKRPGWLLWRDGCPSGETPAQVAIRADRVLAEVERCGGTVALVAHGHLLRVIAARWITLEASWGERLALATGAISVLGLERSAQVISRWNA
jgi:broad specificity phosphatase PhoE